MSPARARFSIETKNHFRRKHRPYSMRTLRLRMAPTTRSRTDRSVRAEYLWPTASSNQNWSTCALHSFWTKWWRHVKRPGHCPAVALKQKWNKRILIACISGVSGVGTCRWYTVWTHVANFIRMLNKTNVQLISCVGTASRRTHA